VPDAALLGAAYALFHVPDLVRYGSKPARQIARDPGEADRIQAGLRAFASALAYPPNQAFIGNLAPEALADIERPWYRSPMESARAEGPIGRILDQQAFYARLAEADVFDLVHLGTDGLPPGAIPLCTDEQQTGWVAAGHPEDASQTADVILENLACKATAVEAARVCLADTDPTTIDYVINAAISAAVATWPRP
jgi:betaine reductase